MKPNSHSTQMDFRIIPSAIPLQSPSPDKKNANNITPTVSPNPIQFKKTITPNKRNRLQKENSKFNADRSTQMKYATHSHSPGIDYSSALKEKQDVIKNLKKIIDLITKNGRRATYENDEENDLKKEIKILTIENQKLVNIIEKMSNNKQIKPEQTMKIKEKYLREINELMETLKLSQQQHSEEQREIKKLYKALNIHCKNIESEKKQLENENKQLLKILKDKNQSEKKINQKSRISQGSEPQSQKSQKSYERITLSKIKEQYLENMKLLRDGLVKQIEETFDTMRIALEGMGSKVANLGSRLESIQKLTWQQIRKSKGQQKMSPLPLRKNDKSEIYIEEGPDSSHHSHQTSKEEFSQVVDSSRQSSIEIEDQLSKVKAELQQLRFKYDKICLDTSSVSYSKRIPLVNKQLEQNYEKSLSEISEKSKQIEILYEQIRNIQKDNLKENILKEEHWENIMNEKIKEIHRLREKHFNQIQDIKVETEMKVKLLIQNYEKQIQMLKKDILIKNTDLHEVSEVHQVQKSSTTTKIDDLTSKIEELKKIIDQKQSKIQIAENKNNQKDIQQNLNKQSWQNQRQTLQNKLIDLEDLLKTDRSKRQQIQQQVIMQMIELSQLRRDTEVSRQKLDDKVNIISSLTEQIQFNKDELDKQAQDKEQIGNKLIKKEKELQLLKQIFQEQSSGAILLEINKLKQHISNRNKVEEPPKSFLFETESQSSVNLIEQLHQLKQQISEKQEKIVSQEARIIQLEGLCELNRVRLEDQQSLYEILIEKSKKIEESCTMIQAKERVDNDSEQILMKLSVIQQLQENRINRIRERCKSE